MFEWLKRGVIETLFSDKNWGWIRSQDNKRYYFHRDGCRRIVTGFTQPVFRSHIGILEADFCEGDAVIFRSGLTSYGPKAEIWGFASEYERAECEIAAREVRPSEVAI